MRAICKKNTIDIIRKRVANKDIKVLKKLLKRYLFTLFILTP